ncbi:hypothetical protein D3C72_2162550 [compost metagenome]
MASGKPSSSRRSQAFILLDFAGFGRAPLAREEASSAGLTALPPSDGEAAASGRWATHSS